MVELVGQQLLPLPGNKTTGRLHTDYWGNTESQLHLFLSNQGEKLLLPLLAVLDPAAYLMSNSDSLSTTP